MTGAVMITRMPSNGSKLDLAAAERLADGKLQTCRCLGALAASLVDTLSEAGSNVQRTLADALHRHGLQAALEHEDPAIRAAVDCLVEACGGISTSLVELAAALSGGLQQPMEELEKAVAADRSRRHAELEELRQQHNQCTGALTESLRLKERTSADLRVALQKMEELSKGNANLGWLARQQKPAIEQRVQEALALQNDAVTQFSAHMEETQMLSSCSQRSTEALAEALSYLDFALQRTLHDSLGSCGGAWEAAAAAFRCFASKFWASTRDLREQGSLLVSGEQSARPTWARAELDPKIVAKADTGLAAGLDANLLSQWRLAAGSSHAGDESQRTASAQLPSAATSPKFQASTTSPKGSLNGKPVSPDGSQQESAEIRAEQQKWREAHEAREIQLLEKEEALRKQQGELDSQMEQVGAMRRSLAFEQARYMAMLDRNSSPDSFVMGGGGSGGRTADGSAGQAAEAVSDVEREEEDVAASENGEVDEVWDMDWSKVAASPGNQAAPQAASNDA